MKKFYSFIISIFLLFNTCSLVAIAEQTYTPVAEYTYNDHLYQIYDEYMTWSDAQLYCESIGGYLVSITDEDEQEFIESMFESSGSRNIYWIGLNCEAELNNWEWSSGEDVDYLNWDDTEPDNFMSRSFYGVYRNVSSSSWNITKAKWGDYTIEGYITSDLSGIHEFPEQFGFICEFENVNLTSNIKKPKQNENIYNGHTYQVFKEELTPPEAEEYCAKLGGHLVTFSSADEQKFTDNLAEKANVNIYTIGASDFEEEGVWKWLNGEEWNYTNWNSPIEPNDGLGQGDDYCCAVKMQNWRWSDYFGGYDGFTTKYPFICEWDYVRSSFGSEVSDWAKDEIEDSYNKQLIPEILIGEDLTQPITRAEFAAVAIKTYELMANTKALPAVNNPFADTKDAEILKAYNVGIVKGISSTDFAPNALLNREQAATMLTRVFKRATMPGWSIDTDGQYKLDYTKKNTFADDAEISSWAKDSVYFMSANGIINGVGNNRFAPQNTTSEEEAIGYANTTREQALIIATRMINTLK